MIFMFTPKGDIIELPRGATVMDFAYAVSESLGNHCIASRVDRLLVPLSTVLSHGVTVEMMTAESAEPSPAWLQVVVTPKAKHAIKRHLNAKKAQQAAQAGERWLTIALGQSGLSQSLSTDQQAQLARVCGAADYQALLVAIGQGECLLGEIVTQVKNLGEQVTWKKEARVLPKPGEFYQIRGDEGDNLEYATCCHPIPGDPIIGLSVANSVIQVHRQGCAVFKNGRKNR